MEEFLLTLVEVNDETFNILVALSLFAAFLLVQGTGSLLLAVAFLPAVIFGGLLSNYLFATFGIVLTEFKTANTVVALTAGMIPGSILMLLVVSIVMRLRESVTDARYRHSIGN